MTASTHERRTAKRISYMCDVECEGGAPDPIKPRMRDLSATGAFVESDSLVAEGTRLVLRFALPSGEISVTAEVVRPQRPGMGVRFVGLTEQQRTAIEEAVARAPSEPW